MSIGTMFSVWAPEASSVQVMSFPTDDSKSGTNSSRSCDVFKTTVPLLTHRSRLVSSGEGRIYGSLLGNRSVYECWLAIQVLGKKEENSTRVREPHSEC